MCNVRVITIRFYKTPQAATGAADDDDDTAGEVVIRSEQIAALIDCAAGADENAARVILNSGREFITDRVDAERVKALLTDPGVIRG